MDIKETIKILSITNQICILDIELDIKILFDKSLKDLNSNEVCLLLLWQMIYTINSVQSMKHTSLDLQLDRVIV